tara:strand:+ start:2639 stop:3913 length:1275 start_codon:yes stop_codon:yes gene_type:complete
MKSERVSPLYRRYVLGVLVLVYAANFVDRQILSILVQPIKEELGVSDTWMGFLTGITFALFYTIAGIPIARWADRGSRRNLIVIGLALWSAMTALSGLAKNFFHLAAARIGVGVGEATLSPAAHSMISDYYPPEKRATALAIYSMGIHLGIFLGYFLGGWINELYGWRAAFMVVGLPGLFLAVFVFFTVREPIRGSIERISDQQQPSIRAVLSFLSGLSSARHLTLATSYIAFAGYGAAIWTPAFLDRVHDMGTGEAGTWLGILTGLFGGMGAFLGGYLADKLSIRDPRFALWLPGMASFAAIPFAVAFYALDDVNLGLICAAPSLVFSAMYLGPSFAVAANLSSLRMRAMTAAILIFVINLVGLGLGPLVVGALNDALNPRFGVEAIRYSLIFVQALMLLLAGTHFFLGARTLSPDLLAKDNL